jgi:hypothetical protein
MPKAECPKDETSGETEGSLGIDATDTQKFLEIELSPYSPGIRTI